MLYAGGEFTQAGGAARNRIAAVDAASGVVAAWNPAADGAVLALLHTGATVYAGGEFTQIGGAGRNRIAALDVSSGAATVGNPDANGAVRALVLNGATLYAGGDFTAIDGGSRAYLAALDMTQATAGAIDTDWDPAPDGVVRALINGTTLYAGGDFTAIDGGSRAYLAALDTTQTAAGAIDTDWNPAPDGARHALLLNGSLLYAGGDFTAMEGLARNRLAALDTSVTGAITDSDWESGRGRHGRGARAERRCAVRRRRFHLGERRDPAQYRGARSRDRRGHRLGPGRRRRGTCIVAGCHRLRAVRGRRVHRHRGAGAQPPGRPEHRHRRRDDVEPGCQTARCMRWRWRTAAVPSTSAGHSPRWAASRATGWARYR